MRARSVVDVRFGSTSPRRASRTALQLSVDQILERAIFGREIGVEPFQSGVLGVELLQTLQLRGAEAAVPRLPRVLGRGTDLRLAQELRDGRPARLSLRTATICASVNRLFFMPTLLAVPPHNAGHSSIRASTLQGPGGHLLNSLLALFTQQPTNTPKDRIVKQDAIGTPLAISDWVTDPEVQKTKAKGTIQAGTVLC